MTYAFYSDSEFKKVNRLPESARKLVDGEPIGDWVMALPKASPELQEACGYYKIKDTQKPNIRNGVERLERNLSLVGGVPTWEYEVKHMTTPELLEKIDTDEREFVRESIKELRTFRKKGDAMSLKDVRDNMDLINRVMIKVIQDHYGEGD